MNTVKRIYKYMRTRIFTFWIDRYENWPKYPNTFRAEIGEWLWQKFDYETKYMLSHRYDELMEVTKRMGALADKYSAHCEVQKELIDKIAENNKKQTAKFLELRTALGLNIENSPNGEVGYWKDPQVFQQPTQIIVEPDVVKTPLQWEQLEFDFKGWTPKNNV